MKKFFKVLIIVVFVLLLVGTIIFIGANIYFNSLMENVNVEEIEEEEINITVIEPKETRHEVVNFMLVGADNSTNEYENSYAQERSDVFKIISLDYTDKKIKITSLDRDVVVWLPIEDKFGHFNWAYSYGGAKSSLAAINYNLDLDVSKYVAISFGGFKDIIDYIDGVDIELTAAEAYTINSASFVGKMNVKEGLNHLNSATALFYARIRHIDSDFVRMDRQNIVIKSVINKIKKMGITDAFSVVSECLKFVTTNLTTDEIKSYLFDIFDFDLSDVETLTYPSGRYDDIRRSSIGGYILRSYSGSVIEIQQFIYDDVNYIPSKKIYDNEKKTYDTFGAFEE